MNLPTMTSEFPSGAGAVDAAAGLGIVAAQPLLLQIDADAAGGNVSVLAGAVSTCHVVRVAGLAAARRALTLDCYDLIVLDPGAAGELASIVLLDTLPHKNQTTPVLFYCDYAPSEACRDRANSLLLKDATPPATLRATIGALLGIPAAASPCATP
ncbi:MAG: hypothetical protein ABWY27_20290 [Telluria sp.]